MLQDYVIQQVTEIKISFQKSKKENRYKPYLRLVFENLITYN